ncbi:hypothetical protein HZH66_001115 [Vespula vulgaris]|uniref:Uncharacterized protein n=1 Tax=Vespula vulgaris TaxID=7454 RepID=A0A834NLE9_VESVU|nr:hypothetical protein HZH66_001115 [Vespula vulgaris]
MLSDVCLIDKQRHCALDMSKKRQSLVSSRGPATSNEGIYKPYPNTFDATEKGIILSWVSTNEIRLQSSKVKLALSCATCDPHASNDAENKTRLTVSQGLQKHQRQSTYIIAIDPSEPSEFF